MRCETYSWGGVDWSRRSAGEAKMQAQLVLFFGERVLVEAAEPYETLRRRFPHADIAGCSTSGQILDGDVSDGGAVAVAIRFDATRTRLACRDLASVEASADCGEALGGELMAPDLRSVFVLADGVGANATALIAGLARALGPDMPVTGGLAGDGALFARTVVGGNCPPAPSKVAAVGFYGDRFRLGYGSDGGWKVFGPPRRVTRASGNVLYELDGKPALDLYKRYLGDDAERLPGSALLFPLKIWNPRLPEQDVVRTIVGVLEAEKALVFAGDVPDGFDAQLMRGSHENLVGGAEGAARAAVNRAGGHDRLAILISCVGRKLLMGQRVGEEAEAVRDCLAPSVKHIGFYSYGELSPHSATGACELHNQTMTITSFGEAA